MKRIPELDGLRAIAVSLVILDHYAPFRTMAHGFAARYGGMGVDIFFVLSGFLITTILLQSRTQPHPYRTFYARRALRILPAYALVLLLVFTAAACLGEPIQQHIVLGQLLFLRSFAGTGQLLHHCLALLHLPGWFRFVPPSLVSADYGHLPTTASFGPTWSLSVEEWFYMLWAPVVMLLPRRAIAATACAICATGLLLRSVPNAGTSFFTSVDILVSGALLALWMERRPSLHAAVRQRLDRSLAAIAIAAALLLVVLSWLDRTVLSGTLIELSVAGGLAAIIPNSGGSALVLRLLRAKPLVSLGTISYMVYLVHLPVYFLVRRGFEGHAHWLAQQQQAWVIGLCSIGATLCFSVASWVWMERPLLRRKENFTALLVRT